MVRQSPEDITVESLGSVNYCFLNPAWMPEWFWLPATHAVAESGADYFIPPVERDRIEVSIEDNVDIVESTMHDKPSQYLVALSRGVEYAVRYIDRMDKKGQLSNILGWMVISSAGPRGYETFLKNFGTFRNRHTENYMTGITLDDSGLEVLDPGVARTCMLHDVEDGRLRDEVITNLVKANPITPAEIENVPYIRPNSLPLAWYVGLNDRVDNLAVSTSIARGIFQVEPTFVNWGHVGPLSHTDQVAKAVLRETGRAIALKEE